MVIEKIEKSDPSLLKQVFEIQQLAYNYEAILIGHAIPTQDETEKDIINDNANYICCSNNGVVFGFIAVEENINDFLISKLCVNPKYFRKGIGFELLTHVVTKLSLNKPIVVSTALKNIPAINLYTKLGFIKKTEQIINSNLTLIHFIK